MRARVELKLLGPFEGRFPDGRQAKLETRKSEALLAYLARHCGESHSREQLAAMFWGDRDDAAARHNLRKALASLRRSFAPHEFLLADRDSLALDPAAVKVDVTLFEELAAAQDTEQLHAASELYRGPFLEGLVSDEQPFDEWLSRERQTLHDRALRLLLQLADAARDPEAAGAALIRAVELDPSCEEAHRRLMRLQIAARRYNAAVRQFHDCAKALQRELDATPEHETLAVYREAMAALSRVSDVGARELPTNLPHQLNSFVGRADEVRDIEALLFEHRLVTVAGPGGSGKTRCAVQIGAGLLANFPGGVWLAELAPIADDSLVPRIVADALRVPQSGDRPLLDDVVAHLQRKQLLIVLDNCEHVVAGARNLAAAVLRNCPGIRILATSRQSLEVTGERVYRVPSLALPPPSLRLNPTGAARYGSLVLFCDRAREAAGHFVLTEENLPSVVAVCRRVDGMPLAIELAAARIKSLSPRQLAQRLDRHFRLLAGGDRNGPPRQQAMSALIDFSYDLLSERDRRMLRMFSVFVGSFTLEMMSAVCVDAHTDEFEVLEALTSLVDKSLVQAEPDGEGMRYRLLETTRAYAARKAADSGEQEHAARRYALACVALGEALDAAWDATPDRLWFAQLSAEREHWRATLEWTLEARNDVLAGQRLVAALGGGFRLFGFAAALGWLDAARHSVNAETPRAIVAQLDLVEARYRGWLNQHEAACESGRRAFEAFAALGESLRVAEAQGDLGRELTVLGRAAEAETLWLEALGTARRLRSRKLPAEILASLAEASIARDDLKEARVRFSEALALAKASEHTMLESIVAANLAEAEFRGGDAAAALRLAGEAVAASRTFNDSTTFSVANYLSNMAAYLVALGRYEEGRVHAREALELARDVQHHTGVACSLQHVAAVAALRTPDDETSAGEDRARAARLFGYTDARLAALGGLREYTEQREYDAGIAALRGVLGFEETDALLAEGRTWYDDRAFAEAMTV